MSVPPPSLSPRSLPWWLLTVSTPEHHLSACERRACPPRSIQSCRHRLSDRPLCALLRRLRPYLGKDQRGEIASAGQLVAECGRRVPRRSFDSFPLSCWIQSPNRTRCCFDFKQTLFYSFYGPEKIADTLNLLNFSAFTLGNHEFDTGNDTLLGEFLCKAISPSLS